MISWDRIWIGGPVATLDPEIGEGDWGLLERGAVATLGEHVAWVGREDELPGTPEALAREVRLLDGALVTPGLVDCHTHLVFGGERAAEFERRAAGATYEEIAREGGGILSTVAATRAADEDTLFRDAARRRTTLLDEGVTTVEVKSGYGLDVETELRMLRVGRRLGRELPGSVLTTLLGAHALPEAFQDRREAYVDLVVEEMIPRAAEEGLADCVDAFCESIAFTSEECRRVLEAGRLAGLAPRLHADQLSDGGGAALAADVGALSADHLEHASPEGLRRMAERDVTAVLLPGAYYFLGEEGPPPPVSVMREEGVRMAVATDCNPGSSPLTSLVTAASMACRLFGLGPEEVMAAITREAARAVGREDRGILAPGKRADLVVWEATHPREMAYWIDGPGCREVVAGGETVRGGLPSGS